MAQAVLITLTTAGSDTGPFNLLSNLDGYTVPFESNVPKLDLEAGYISYLVPDGASNIRVQSVNVLCQNYVDLSIETTTTTTTSSTSSTTTTTTTLPPEDYDFYVADMYSCGTCSLEITNVLVAFPTGTSVIISNYYQSNPIGDKVYRIVSSTSSGPGPVILTDAPSSLCSSVPCLG